MEARQIEEQRALQARRIKQQQESNAKRPAAPSSYQEPVETGPAAVTLWELSLAMKPGQAGADPNR
jgi:hypothetical protein